MSRIPKLQRKLEPKSPRAHRVKPRVEQLETRNLLSTVAPLASVLQPPGIVHIDGSAMSVTPNDPYFGSQWDMQAISVPAAWTITTGSPGTTVAVIDTGVNYDHPDLYQNIWINQAEIPLTRLRNLVDVNHDGLITFADLNNPINQGVGKITDVNHDGRIDAADILAPMVLDAYGNDTGLGGWAHGSIQDGDIAHPDDLIGWNFVDNTNNPFDDNGHGTHVSGTIGAMGNNGVGIAGVNWNVQIMALKFLDASGSGYDYDAAAAVNYAVAHGASILNNSWGGSPYDPVLLSAIQNAQAHGAIFVVAAGNSGQNIDAYPSFPASFNLSNMVVVAASDQYNQLASFSNYGAGTVALAAPGVSILSTLNTGGYAWYSGTSMATPHVTGVLALLKSEHPDWSYVQLINQVLSTTTPLPSLQGRVRTGGLLNAAAALESTAQNTAFIEHLYADMLGRQPGALEVSGWLIQLEGGVSRDQVAQEFWQSFEHRDLQVESYYLKFMYRSASAGERFGWDQLFLSGWSEADVMRGLLLSGEYAALHSGNQSFVDALYQDVLGRTAGANEDAAWLRYLQATGNRYALVQSFLASSEEQQRIVNGLYSTLLNRPAGSVEVQAWMSMLLFANGNQAGIASAIAGSGEFYNLP